MVKVVPDPLVTQDYSKRGRFRRVQVDCAGSIEI